MAVQENHVEEAQAKLALLLAGSRREAIDAAEAEAARIETHRRHLLEQLRRTLVVSPASGVVTTPKLEERVGKYVGKGDLIAEVYALDNVTPEVAISEKDIAEVRPEQKVVLKARAYPSRRFEGVVQAVAPAAVEDPKLGRKVFRVTVAVDQASDLLRPEMTGHAKISCGRRRVVSLLTRRIARYLRVEFWSWW